MQGVDGPFAVALSERCYAELTEATDGGYPVLQHVRRLIDGPLVWAPGLDGAVVLSMRGDDFQLTVGQDFSIGYLDHNAERVRLYIEESFTFWLQSPQAAVPLVFPEVRWKADTQGSRICPQLERHCCVALLLALPALRRRRSVPSSRRQLCRARGHCRLIPARRAHLAPPAPDRASLGSPIPAPPGSFSTKRSPSGMI